MTTLKTKTVSPRTGAKRLLKLADALEAAVKTKKYKFNMERWVGRGNSNNRKSTKESDCGTAGCAVGYCPIVFPRLAKYKIEKAVCDEIRVQVRFKGLEPDPRGFYDSVTDVAGQFFGLLTIESFHLFSPSAYQLQATRSGLIPMKPVIEKIRAKAKQMLETK